jgi:DNA-directed RNA polymerase subunit E'/Rpb7
MDSIYSECILKKKIILNSNSLNKNIDDQLNKKLKELCENKCNNEGFIKKDSIEILKRYNGYIKPNIDLSNICFTILFKCLICNPKPNLILDCKVIEIIKPGIICDSFPLSIILPEQLHFNKELYNSIKINDTVKIKILNSKFHINEFEIQCVGILLEDKEKKVIKISKKNLDILDNNQSLNNIANDNFLLNSDESDDNESIDEEEFDEDEDSNIDEDDIVDLDDIDDDIEEDDEEDDEDIDDEDIDEKELEDELISNIDSDDNLSNINNSEDEEDKDDKLENIIEN